MEAVRNTRSVVVGIKEEFLNLSEVREKIKALEENIQGIIKGKPKVIRNALAALLSRGHILIEDVPGVGKTTLAQAIARSTELSFKRIQFTSDLLPSDILGVSVFDQKTGEFVFKPGPIFANVVLADEINRATPKTQSALLEAMSESRVTVDGVNNELPRPFMVIATQNPFEYRGTFPLPENQLDRFSMRISIGYPDYQSEKQILSDVNASTSLERVTAIVTKQEILTLQMMVERVHIDESLLDYILAIVRATRDSSVFELGVSPRGAIALKRAAQAHALIEGRDFCIPDDIKEMAIPVLAHRVVAKSELSLGKLKEDDIFREVIEKIKVPV